ncbi:MAG: hypothetical protein LLG06_17455 [Desulfobacteraceae bacterium]|nr:hypothetical protein [Desulfobacteraceae bacterium]
MRFYIDSADRSRIESLMKTGVFSGVTTNPLILRRDGMRMSELPDFTKIMFGLGAGEVFLQSWGDCKEALCANGRWLASIGKRVVVKMPATREGLAAASALSTEGVSTCITAVFAPFQALLAAASGASFVAPYLGRMNDAGRDGHAMVAEMSEALRNAQRPCEILAASIRTPDDVGRLARNGVRRITLPPALAERLFDEQLTREAATAFEEAATEVLEG